MSLSVVVPTLNAAAVLPACLDAIAGPPAAEIIVVDGASSDETAGIATARGARLLAAPRGRGPQFAAGIAAARRDWLLLLHADTRLAPSWRHEAVRAMAGPPTTAFYFRFALDSADPRARRLERLVAWRCARLGLPYGDQGLLIPRALLDAVGGMRPLPLMEDLDLARRLGRARLAALPADAATSAVRWECGGWLRRSARNLACVGLWYAGIPPRVIARLYA